VLTREELALVLMANGIELDGFAIGNGGSAVVHRGRLVADHKDIGPEHTLLAIKEYKDDIVQKSEQIERIRHEVEVGKIVKNPNVVAIHTLIDSGRTAPLLVMEWVSGQPLDEWVRASDPDWSALRKVALGLLQGLGALHTAKVKHRDLKPANIFVRDGGEPVIMDMGVVEIASNDESTLHTRVGDFIGTVRYAAPQFILGEAFDFADDVYSLAATLFQAITRKEVFDSVDRKPLLPHYILTQGPKVGEVPSGIPPQISVLLEGAMHRDRARRPSLAEIQAFLDSPETASYLQRELDARNREKRGYQVISVRDNGASVYADMRGAEPRERSFAVIRELPALQVPSLGGLSKPEKWIADVELKHMQNGIGHFAVKGKRWVPGNPPAFASGLTGC